LNSCSVPCDPNLEFHLLGWTADCFHHGTSERGVLKFAEFCGFIATNHKSSERLCRQGEHRDTVYLTERPLGQSSEQPLKCLRSC
jgi:hypothetical protein